MYVASIIIIIVCAVEETGRGVDEPSVEPFPRSPSKLIMTVQSHLLCTHLLCSFTIPRA